MFFLSRKITLQGPCVTASKYNDKGHKSFQNVNLCAKNTVLLGNKAHFLCFLVTVNLNQDSHQYVNRHGNHSINVLFGVGASGQFYVCDSSQPGGVQDSRVLRRSKFFRDHLSQGALITDGITITDGGFKTNMANLCNPIVTRDLPWAEIAQRNRSTIDQIRRIFDNYNEVFVQKRNTIERYANNYKTTVSICNYVLMFLPMYLCALLYSGSYMYANSIQGTFKM